MLIKNDTGGTAYDNGNGTFTDTSTMQTYNSYSDLLDAYNQREQESRASFSEALAGAFDNMRYQGINSNVTYTPTAGAVATVTTDDFKSFYDNRNVMYSSFSALTQQLSQNTMAFGLSDAETNRRLEEYTQSAQSLALPDDLKKQVLQEAKIQDNNPEWDLFVRNHQALAQWLAVPQNYARANDDVQNQAGVSKLLQEGAYASFRKSLQDERGRLYWHEANGEELTQAQKDRIAILNAMIAKFSREDKSGRSALGFAGNLLGGITPTLGEGIKGAMAGASAGAIAGVVTTGGFGTIPFALAGAGYGAVIAMAHREAQSGAGNLYGDVFEKTKEKPTVKATAYGALVGVANAFPMGVSGRVLEATNETGVLKALGKQTVKDTIISGLLGSSDYATQEGIRQTYGIGRDSTIGDMIWNMALAGGTNAIFSIAMSTPAYAWVGLHELGKVVDSTNVMSRQDKVAQAQLIDSQVKNTPIHDVNVSAEALKNYMQGADTTKIDNEDFLRLAKSKENFNTALQTGVPLKVSLGEFVTINPNMRKALLPDVATANQLSLREYQSVYDTMMSMYGGEEVTSTYEPNFQVYNMLQESGNEDILKIISDTEKALKNDGNLIKASDIEKAVDENFADVEAGMKDNPTYSLADRIQNDEELVLDFDLQRFGEDGKYDLKAWAQEHLQGFDDPHKQALLDNLAHESGFSSGAEFLNSLSKAPTREEIKNTIRQQVTRSFNVEYSNGASLALNEIMEKAFGTNKFLYALADNPSQVTQSMEKVAVDRYTAKIDALTAQMKNIDNTTVVSANAKNIKDARVEALKKEIKALKEEQKEYIKSLKKEFTKTKNEAVAKEHQKGNERVEKTREKANQKMADFKAGLREVAKGIKLNKQDARKGQLTISKAREIARNNMAELTISDILNRQQYSTAIKKATREATGAFLKGDYYEAINQTNKVMENVAYLEESHKLEKKIVKLDRYMTKLSRKKQEYWGTEEAQNQANKIMSIIGVRRGDIDVSLKLLPVYLNERAGTSGMSATIPDSIYPIFSVGNETRAVKDLTLEQYQDIKDLLDNIRHIGKHDGEMYQHNLDVKLRDTREKMVDSLRSNFVSPRSGKAFDPTLSRAERSSSRKIGQWLETYANIDTWCNAIEGRDGVFRKFFIDLRRERATILSQYMNEINDRLTSLKDMYTNSERRKNDTRNLFIEEWKVTCSKDDLIGLALNAGCLDNWNKMFSLTKVTRDGGLVEYVPNKPVVFSKAENWSQDSLKIVLGKYLDKRDWEFIEGHWKLFEDLWGGASAFEKARTGFTPKKAELHEFDVVLNDGTTKHISGGFYPLMKDPNARLVGSGANRSAFDVLQNDIGELTQNYGVPTMTKQGHFASRTGAKYVLNIDFKNQLPKYFSAVGTDIAFRDWSIMANNIIKDPSFQTELFRRHGDGAIDFLAKNILDTVGSNYRDIIPDGTSALNTYLKDATNASLVALNPSILLQSFTNPLLAPYTLKDFGIADVVSSLIKHGIGSGIFPFTPQFQRMTQDCYRLSPLFRDLLGNNPNYAIYRDYGIIDKGAFDRLRNKISWLSKESMSAVDRMTVIPIFKGMVDKGLSKGMTEQEAIRYAETGISRILPSDKKYEQSNFINAPKNSWQNFINGLASYSNIILNNIMRGVDLSARVGGAEYGRFAVQFTSAVIISALFTDIFAFRSPLSSDKHEPDEWGKWSISTGVGAVASLVPIIGEPLRAGVLLLAGEPYYGTKSSTGLSTVVGQAGTFVQKMASSSGKIQTEDKVEAGAKAIAMSTGIPQYFINLFFNLYEATQPGGKLEVRDIIKRRPYEER